MGRSNSATLFLSLLLILAIFVIAGLVVVLVVARSHSPSTPPHGEHTEKNPFLRKVLKQDQGKADDLRKKLFGEFKTANMHGSMTQLTGKVHVAGTTEQLQTMDKVAEMYRSYGLEVVASDYEVLLSYPDYDDPNTVHRRRTEADPWEVVSEGKADVLGPPEAVQQQADHRGQVWWNAYSTNATVTGKLVYANHGTLDDYKYLDDHHINISGAIVLARYGELWRGAKVFEAEKRGAIGVILFSDPADDGPPPDQPEDMVFPKANYLPPGGAQRGTVSQVNGDPLTPLHPAKPYAFRTETEEHLRDIHDLPNIPVTPIGYRDAKRIFEEMDGVEAPIQFQGQIRNVTYRLNTVQAEFKLKVRAISDSRARIRNVVGYFKGAEEPDRYVLLMNHVDAWTYGALDPNTGTTQILEVARTMAAVANQTGWRPRRSILFCSWDSEEFGLIGSQEWAEEFQKILEQRAVALVNVDVLVADGFFDPSAGPLMYRPMVDATKLVSNPNPAEVQLGRKTVYDSWKHYTGNNSYVPEYPGISLTGSGSDQNSFIAFLGVPGAVLDYNCMNRSRCYPLYHSNYEIAWTLENLVDPGYKVNTAVAMIWMEMARNLADSLIIPFNVEHYSTMLRVEFSNLAMSLTKKGLNNVIPDYNQVMANLHDVFERFAKSTAAFESAVSPILSGQTTISVRQAEQLNSRLTQLDRAFINPRGVYPGARADTRHVVFSASIHDDYAGVAFASVGDPVEFYLEAVRMADEAMAAKWLKQVRLSLSELQYAVESAILVLGMTDFEHA